MISRLMFPVICAFFASCAAPPEPQYTGPLPKLPKRWPSTQSDEPDGPSHGWHAMLRIWNSALKQSPATPDATKALRRLVVKEHWGAEVCWLSPEIAISKFNDGSTLGVSSPRMVVFVSNGTGWLAVRRYSDQTEYWEVFDIPVPLTGMLGPWTTVIHN